MTCFCNGATIIKRLQIMDQPNDAFKNTRFPLKKNGFSAKNCI